MSIMWIEYYQFDNQFAYSSQLSFHNDSGWIFETKIKHINKFLRILFFFLSPSFNVFPDSPLGLLFAQLVSKKAFSWSFHNMKGPALS